MTKIFEALEQARRERERLEAAMAEAGLPGESPRPAAPASPAAASGPTDLPAGLFKEGEMPGGLRRLLRHRVTEDFAIEGNLLSAAKGRPIRSIYITSCRSGEGKTTAAVTLACGLARSGYGKVLLVDGNFDAPRLHTLFETPAEPGLTDFLAGQATMNAILRPTGHPNLALATVGARPASYGDAITPEGFADKIASMTGLFDYIIVDGSPALTSSAACLAARRVDAVIFVAECQKTKWEVLRIARDKIENLGGHVVGVILNKRRYYVPKFLYHWI